MKRPRVSALALRLYAFTAVISVAVMASLILLPRYLGSPRYLDSQAALVQTIVERLAQRDPVRRGEVLVRLAARLRGRLTLYDAQQVAVGSTADPVPPPTPGERADLVRDKWSLSHGRIVVRSDDGSLFAAYLPNRPGFPWHFVLPIGLGALVVVGAATLWFSRTLVRPLGALASAAQRFGGGETTARANLTRADELGEVGRAFDDMADRTAAVLAAQRQLLADVSHELRTPLARIRVALELAAEDPAAAQDMLASVGTDLDEIDQLIEDLFTTARLDTGLELRRAPVPLGQLAERAAETFTARHPGRVLEQAGSDAARQLACPGDAALLRRALDNLLDNAAKYSEAAVTLAIEDAGAISVVDRGVGMSAEELASAFQPFWRADPSRTRAAGGVGLGLALARRIARAHGGDVTLESTPGRGTTARLTLPTDRGGS